MLLMMAGQGGHLDRPARWMISKRVIGFVVVCALFSLIWLNIGSVGHLRKAYDAISKQAAKSAILAGDKTPNGGVQLLNPSVSSLQPIGAQHDAPTPSTSISSPAPFPALPPPDNKEYMAICMAGQYLEVHLACIPEKFTKRSTSQ